MTDRPAMTGDTRAAAAAAAVRARQNRRARLGWQELSWLALVVAAASALGVHLVG